MASTSWNHYSLITSTATHRQRPGAWAHSAWPTPTQKKTKQIIRSNQTPNPRGFSGWTKASAKGSQSCTWHSGLSQRYPGAS
ncbi:hypothetical protein LINPERPRIM_LOCUS31686 [Linum perenne]